VSVPLPRLRQVVLAARDLEAVSARLREELGLGEPFGDEAVEYFGLRNAVFALGDQFLEVVSPVREDTAAGRLLERRGAQACGYMLMFQVDDVGGARTRAIEAGVREVFAVELEDMQEVHLHPADMRGAIVSLSAPRPPESWRWGGPRWRERSAPLQVTGARLVLPGAARLSARWEKVLGSAPGALGVELDEGERERGLAEVLLRGARPFEPLQLDQVRVLSAAGEGERRT
jgi:hypothetical protein